VKALHERFRRQSNFYNKEQTVKDALGLFTCGCCVFAACLLLLLLGVVLVPAAVPCAAVVAESSPFEGPKPAVAERFGKEAHTVG